MHIQGIDEVTFSAEDLSRCKTFFLDWGLALLEESDTRLIFESLNGCRLVVAKPAVPGLPAGLEPDPTIRQIVWSVNDEATLQGFRRRLSSLPGFVDEGHRVGCVDPAGLSLRIQVSRKRQIALTCARSNSWNERARIDAPSPSYDRAQPIEVGHVVLFVQDLAACTGFYVDQLGFSLSDSYPGRGSFLRGAPRGGHHDLFLLQLPQPKVGLNHVAFTVRDIHEVFGGGLHMSRCGWDTELGPGRHPISSAIFWYFVSPVGGLVEYYSDEDELTEAWQPREFTPGPTLFAEWAIKGGIDGNTRRQKDAEAPTGRFMTERAKG